MRMRMPMTTTNDSTIVTTLPSRARGDPGADLLARPCVDRYALVYRLEGAAGIPVERALDQFRNLHEADPPVEERRDRDLVRGVEHRGREPAGLERPAREPKARE